MVKFLIVRLLETHPITKYNRSEHENDLRFMEGFLTTAAMLRISKVQHSMNESDIQCLSVQETWGQTPECENTSTTSRS
jgi:hypothetical protein